MDDRDDIPRSLVGDPGQRAQDEAMREEYALLYAASRDPYPYESDIAQGREQFDAWLAAHDDAVRAAQQPAATEGDQITPAEAVPPMHGPVMRLEDLRALPADTVIRDRSGRVHVKHHSGVWESPQGVLHIVPMPARILDLPAEERP